MQLTPSYRNSPKLNIENLHKINTKKQVNLLI